MPRQANGTLEPVRKPWWMPGGWHAETWVCSMRGHVAAASGHDAAGDGPGDDRLVRGDLVRCVRCDAWVPLASVDREAERVPLPRRGK